MKYHKCNNDLSRLISSPKDVQDDICEWPQVEHVEIYNHLILSRACDGEEM